MSTALIGAGNTGKTLAGLPSKAGGSVRRRPSLGLPDHQPPGNFTDLARRTAAAWDGDEAP
jgi:hypothetical protein